MIPGNGEKSNQHSVGEDVARLREAAFVSVRRAALDKDRLFSGLSPELRERVYRSPASSARELAAGLPDEPFSHTMGSAASVVEDVIRVHPHWRDRFRERNLPACVYLPSRAIRERVLRATDSGNLLVEVGDGLFLFLTKVARIVGRVAEIASPSSLGKLLEADPSALPLSPEPAEGLRNLLASLVLCGHPGLAPSFRMGPDAERLLSQLSTAMLFFVVSRAFVHHLSDDFREASTVSAGIEGFEAQELFFSLDREVETDQMALDLMARAADRAGVPNGIFTLAPFLYLQGCLAVRRTVEQLEHSGRSFAESDARRAGLPTFVSERLAALADSGPKGGKLPAIVRRNSAWLGELFECLRASSLEFFDRCRELGLAAGSVDRPEAPHAFWLTPMAYDGDGRTVKPFYRIEDRARVEAIHQHVGQLEPLRPYVLPYKHDVVICYRASLYLESARRLGELLRGAGVDALHDELFVPPGTDWEPQLREAIGSARIVVMQMSLTDLGSGLMDDLVKFPVMKEIRWAGETGIRFFVAGVSHLSVEGETGAIFRSMIDIFRTVADGSLVRKDFPVLMVQSENGLLPIELDSVLARDVQDELAQTP